MPARDPQKGKSMPMIIGRNVSVQKAQRLSVAFGRELGLGRDASIEEIDGAAVDYLRRVVDQQEDAMAREQRVKTPFDLA